MKPVRRAVIDVGTNSTKLLVADLVGNEVHPVWEGSIQTRLGQGFYDTLRLQPGPIDRTAQAVASYAHTAKSHEAVSTRVIATSAARDAMNAAELLGAIEVASGLKVEILSGESEAEWVFQGVTSDPQFAQQPLLLLDVGGGSTEFILGQGVCKHFARSFPLGTVRLLEEIPHGDPPAGAELARCRARVRQLLLEMVLPQLQPLLKQPGDWPHLELVGTGGTTTILARIAARLDRFDRKRIEQTRLSRDWLRRQAEDLWSQPLALRQQILGLPKKRADVILTGVVIYEGVMELFGFDELRVSTRGLRYAGVLNPP